MKYKNKQKGGQENNKQLAITNGSSQSNINNQVSLGRTSDGGDKFVPIKRIPYDIQIFSFLCILGIVFRMIFARASNDYATATVWGYGFSVLSLFGLIISSFAISSKKQLSQGILGFFKNVLATSLPIIFSLVIVTLIILQNISFYDQINSGKVADEYYSFSGISSFLILVQISITINYLLDKLKGNTTTSKNTSDIMSALASELNSIIIILTLANVTFVGMLQVILKYFSTDG